MTGRKGFKHSEETKKKISEKIKANPKGFALNPYFYSRNRTLPRITKICPICNENFESRTDKKQKTYCSKVCYNKISGGYKPNSTRVHRKIYKNIQMDSGAEEQFAILLDKNNIQWIKNSKISFPFVDSNGKDRKYFPDFYLPDYNYWIEIKGKRYIREDDNLRLKAVGNIQLIMSHELRLPDCIQQI